MPQKIVVLATRKEGVSDERLRAEQANHIPMVQAFGKEFILKYEYGFGLPTPDGAGPLADVIVEITVTSFEAFFAGLETPGGMAARDHADSYLAEVKFHLFEKETAWG